MNLELRYLGLFLLGALVGGQLNRGIYRLAWFRRSIGPWSTPLADAPGRHWSDRIPIVGWWGLRREAALHGRGFWIRPLLLELATGVCFATLYWYEVVTQSVMQLPPGMPATPGLLPLTAATLHAQYFSHLILFCLMLVATFIDFDEQTIPDAITVPGTLIGLILAIVFPLARPIAIVRRAGWMAEPLSVVSGNRQSAEWMELLSSQTSLLIGLGCFLAWCVAVVPWLWTTRRGLGKAVQYFAVSFWRRLSPGMVFVAMLGSLAIGLVWAWGNPTVEIAQHRWESLFSALVGVAIGGGLIWTVRVVAGHALGQEAMGFGDVTLMAMIGAFTGWQATLIIFFLAPFAALFISVTQWLLTRRRDIAFGPYLCLAACYLIVDWGNVWTSALPIFELGWFVPGVLAVGLALMGILLVALRWLRETIMGDDVDDDTSRLAEATPTHNPQVPESRK